MQQKFLLQALKLAEIRRGFCAPNPAVGAVLVKAGRVIAKGYHWASGEPHAEKMALAEVNHEAYGASLYVTLEPCCHWGKTAPCTELIIKSGIAEVIYGINDPNPLMNGRGVKLLQAAGVKCQQLSLPEINLFYRSYNYWLARQRPWVTAKLALSLDGKIAQAGGKSIAITGPDLAIYTHQCRERTDAILTTAVTLNRDNSRLNVRLQGKTVKKPVFVLDSKLTLRKDLHIYQTAAELTVFHLKSVDPAKLARLQQKGVHCVAIAAVAGRLDLQQVMAYIGAAGRHDLWVEAGGQCFEALLAAQLINTVLIYLSPKTLGHDAYSAFQGGYDLLHNHADCRWRQMGPEVVCQIDYAG